MAPVFAARMRSWGLSERVLRMVSNNQGGGRKVLVPRKVMVSSFSSTRGAFRFNKSSMELQARMSLAEGVTISILSKAAISLITRMGAMRVPPRRQATLSEGERMDPPRFLKLWRTMIPCPASPARMAESGSLVRS